MILFSAQLKMHHLHPDVRLALITADSVYNDNGAGHVKANHANASTEWDGGDRTTEITVRVNVHPLPAGSAGSVADEIEVSLPDRFTVSYKSPNILITSVNTS